jgi:HrpA-like RNA helicase
MVILKAKQLDLNYGSQIFENPYEFLLGVMNPPEREKIKEAIERLLREEALIGEGSEISHAKDLKLTKIGEFMVSMPCDMQISKFLMMGIKLRIPGLVVAVAALMAATKMFFAHEDRRINN